MITVNITGLDAVKAQLGAASKQATYAASRALNTTAFAVRDQLKTTMAATFAGGATAYTLRAFNVAKSSKANLAAEVALRTDTQGAALPYNKALGHLFTGGQRKYKKIEGALRARKLLPSGLTIAPGSAMRLDSYGNMDRRQLTELMSMLIARPTTMRTIRKTGAGKAPKMVDYFTVQPGARTRLHPGIYKRVETGKTSAVEPMILYVNPVSYRKFIDLEKLGTEVVAKTFQAAFDKELTAALASAK